MAIIVIDTQVYENYGAHDWDGTGECPQYWKAKGGHCYKIPVEWDADYEWAEVYAGRIVDKVLETIGEDTEYYRETVIGWSIKENGWLSWYEKSQLDYDGVITYPEPVIEYKEVA
jgi:hypothetical protein